MNRAVLVTAGILFLAGGSLFAFKHWHLGMAIEPDPSARVWRVDFAIEFVGDEQFARLDLILPTSTDRQVILDEETLDGGLDFKREDRIARRATWSGVISGWRQVLYGMRVHIPSATDGPLERITPDLAPPLPRVSANGLQNTSREIPLADVLTQLRIQPDDAPNAIIASVFGFIKEDIQTVSNGSYDPRVVLSSREGSLAGKTHLLLDLLRAGGLDAKLGAGLRLPRAGSTRVEPFVEVDSGGRKVRLLASTDGPDAFPEDFLTLSRGDRSVLTSNGVVGANLRVTTIRESLPADEMAAFVSPNNTFIRAISLYRLPVSTRSSLLTILVLPLAVLIASALRNLVGIRTFGTFMPVLIALSLRETGLAAGLLLISGCLIAGVIGRLLLDRLRLLFVPRVCLLLCIVILAITGLAQLGHAWGVPDLGSGLLFPIIILAMLIERISVTTLEEGWASSAILFAGSLILAAVTYPVFRSTLLGHLFQGFPELILCVMSGLVLIGGYTGYRLADLWRFRSLVREPEGESA